MTEKIDFQAFMAGLEEGQNAEYEAAFNAYCDLEKLESERARFLAAADRTTGLEYDANIRNVAEIDAAMGRVRATLKAISESDSNTQQQELLPEGRHRQQEAQILAMLRELGYDPNALPTREAGKSGAKREVRGRLPDMTDAVFKKAWERLRSFGDIAGGD